MAGMEQAVVERWNRAKGSSFGRWLFSRAVGRFAPYTGTIGARIAVLEPGRAVVTMRDRKAVRNHLRSVHAVALTNLIELSGSLSIIASMHPGTRMIPVRLESEFREEGARDGDRRRQLRTAAVGVYGRVAGSGGRARCRRRRRHARAGHGRDRKNRLRITIAGPGSQGALPERMPGTSATRGSTRCGAGVPPARAAGTAAPQGPIMKNCQAICLSRRSQRRSRLPAAIGAGTQNSKLKTQNY